MSLVRETCRNSVAEFVQLWLEREKQWGRKGFTAIQVKFADEAALKAYADSPAQKEWYKIYIPIREESTTFDITN